VDHVNGGGRNQRRKFSSRGYYAFLLQEVLDGSDEYQLLCANCNFIKMSDAGENRASAIESGG